MDHHQLDHELETGVWREHKARLTSELEQIQKAMIADTSIWNKENTTRCATIVSNLKHVDLKLEELESNEVTNAAHTAPQGPIKSNISNQTDERQQGIMSSRKSQTADKENVSRRYSRIPPESFGPIVTTIDVDEEFGQKSSCIEPSNKRQKISSTSDNENADTDCEIVKVRSFPAGKRLDKLELQLLSLEGYAHNLNTSDCESKPLMASKLSSTIRHEVIRDLNEVQVEGEQDVRRKKLIEEAEKIKGWVDAVADAAGVRRSE